MPCGRGTWRPTRDGDSTAIWVAICPRAENGIWLRILQRHHAQSSCAFSFRPRGQRYWEPSPCPKFYDREETHLTLSRPGYVDMQPWAYSTPKCFHKSVKPPTRHARLYTRCIHATPQHQRRPWQQTGLPLRSPEHLWVLKARQKQHTGPKWRHYAQQTQLAPQEKADRGSHDFAFTPRELTAIAEDMLNENKQSVSDAKLLEGLVSSAQSGITDNKDQIRDRKQRFGENRLPSRKEVNLAAWALRSQSWPHCHTAKASISSWGKFYLNAPKSLTSTATPKVGSMIYCRQMLIVWQLVTAALMSVVKVIYCDCRSHCWSSQATPSMISQ